MAETQSPLYFDRLVQILLQAKKALAAPVVVPPEVAALDRTGPRPEEAQPRQPPTPAPAPRKVVTKPNRASPKNPAAKASA